MLSAQGRDERGAEENKLGHSIYPLAADAPPIDAFLARPPPLFHESGYIEGEAQRPRAVPAAELFCDYPPAD